MGGTEGWMGGGGVGVWGEGSSQACLLSIKRLSNRQMQARQDTEEV